MGTFCSAGRIIEFFCNFLYIAAQPALQLICSMAQPMACGVTNDLTSIKPRSSNGDAEKSVPISTNHLKVSSAVLFTGAIVHTGCSAVMSNAMANGRFTNTSVVNQRSNPCSVQSPSSQSARPMPTPVHSNRPASPLANGCTESGSSLKNIGTAIGSSIQSHQVGPRPASFSFKTSNISKTSIGCEVTRLPSKPMTTLHQPRFPSRMDSVGVQDTGVGLAGRVKGTVVHGGIAAASNSASSLAVRLTTANGEGQVAVSSQGCTRSRIVGAAPLLRFPPSNSTTNISRISATKTTSISEIGVIYSKASSGAGAPTTTTGRHLTGITNAQAVVVSTGVCANVISRITTSSRIVQSPTGTSGCKIIPPVSSQRAPLNAGHSNTLNNFTSQSGVGRGIVFTPSAQTPSALSKGGQRLLTRACTTDAVTSSPRSNDAGFSSQQQGAPPQNTARAWPGAFTAGPSQKYSPEEIERKRVEARLKRQKCQAVR